MHITTNVQVSLNCSIGSIVVVCTDKVHGPSLHHQQTAMDFLISLLIKSDWGGSKKVINGFVGFAGFLLGFFGGCWKISNQFMFGGDAHEDGEGGHRANGDGQAGDPGEEEGITKEYEEKSLATETGGEGEFSTNALRK